MDYNWGENRTKYKASKKINLLVVITSPVHWSITKQAHQYVSSKLFAASLCRFFHSLAFSSSLSVCDAPSSPG